jgi:hypothetical protein
MPMTLSGDGTIAGLVAGGLPDATVTSADLASGAVNTQTLSLLNASGSAPVYACRAWVNFNGTGTVAIRASGNVSSITDIGAGDYTVNFATAMPDGNYCVGGTAASTVGTLILSSHSKAATTTSGCRVFVSNTASGGDNEQVCVSFFR